MFGSGLLRICFRAVTAPIAKPTHLPNTTHLPPVKKKILQDIFNNNPEEEVKKVYEELKTMGLENRHIGELIAKKPELFKRA